MSTRLTPRLTIARCGHLTETAGRSGGGLFVAGVALPVVFFNPRNSSCFSLGIRSDCAGPVGGSQGVVCPGISISGRLFVPLSTFLPLYRALPSHTLPLFLSTLLNPRQPPFPPTTRSQVVEMKPNDKDAKKKLQQCEKMMFQLKVWGRARVWVVGGPLFMYQGGKAAVGLDP